MLAAKKLKVDTASAATTARDVDDELGPEASASPPKEGRGCAAKTQRQLLFSLVVANDLLPLPESWAGRWSTPTTPGTKVGDVEFLWLNGISISIRIGFLLVVVISIIKIIVI